MESSLLKMNKSSAQTHLGYVHFIHDQACNIYFQNKIESIKYNATLTVSGTKRASTREKLYQEIGLEALQQKRWYRKLCCFL